MPVKITSLRSPTCCRPSVEASERTHRSAVHKIEIGGVDLPISKVQKFADALCVSPAYLMGWEEDSEPPITSHEKEILRKYRCLPAPVQGAVDAMIDAQYALACPRVKNEEEIS